MKIHAKKEKQDNIHNSFDKLRSREFPSKALLITNVRGPVETKGLGVSTTMVLKRWPRLKLTSEALFDTT